MCKHITDIGNDMKDVSDLGIPTTEEILLRYSDSRYYGKELDAQFYRWLAEVKAEAWEQGYAAGDADAPTSARLNRENPYRNENNEL